MFGRSLLFVALTFLLITCLQAPTSSAQSNHLCAPSSCGNLHNISSPFRLKGNPQNCGYHMYELVCENNQTVLYFLAGKYHVQSINYNNSTIRVVDANVSKDNCSSLPQCSMPGSNFSYEDPYDWHPEFSNWSYQNECLKIMMFIKCENPVSSPFFVETAPCIDAKYSNYVLFHGENVSNVENSCNVVLTAMSSWPVEDHSNLSYIDIHNRLFYGFELWWHEVRCLPCGAEELCFVRTFPCPT